VTLDAGLPVNESPSRVAGGMFARSNSRGPTAAETVAALKASMGGLDMGGGGSFGSAAACGRSFNGRPPAAPWSPAAAPSFTSQLDPDEEEPSEILGVYPV
jgi:hypothetical protein